MKKLNQTIAVFTLVTIFTLVLSSCHRNTCPTFNKVSDVETEVRA